MSAVEGLRREEREDGVVRPPSEGVGVQDCRSLGGLELAETTEVLMYLQLKPHEREPRFVSRRSLSP